MSASPAARRYLAVDLGASSGRVIDVRIGEGGVRLKECHRIVHNPSLIDVEGTRRLCWDLDAIVDQVVVGLGSAASGAPIDGIGIDTWGVDYGLLDAQGELVAPVTAYRDVRHEGTFESVQASIGRERLYGETGVQFQPFNTIYQLAADALEPSRPLDRTERMLMMPWLVANRLCGSVTGERTNASTSQCFDSRTNCWTTGMLDELGVPTAILPEVVSPDREEPIGHLLPEIAAKTGLPASTPLFAIGTHDTASAVASAPISSSSEAFISSGTWSPMGVELDEVITTPDALARNFTNEAGVLGTNRFLKNVAGLWLLQQARATWEIESRSYDWSELVDMAEASTPFHSIFNTDDRRLSAPGDMPKRIRELCTETGEPIPQDDAAIVRSIFDSLALKYADCIDEIEEVTGRNIERVVIVGGGSQNMLLNQITADVTRRPVKVGPAEATALGNGLVQHAAVEGIEDLETLRSLVPTASEIDPLTIDQGHLEEIRTRFQKSIRQADT